MNSLTESLKQFVTEDFRSRVFSQKTLSLPLEVRTQAENFVRSLFQLRSKLEYKDYFSESLNSLGFSDPGNRSILMCYDFHLTSDNTLKLIEVNTNASLLLGGLLMYEENGIVNPFGFSVEGLKEDILQEWKLFCRSEGELGSIAIIDEKPESQAMYPEFLMYQHLFNHFGWECDIHDYRSLDFNQDSNKVVAGENAYDFIYNRYCDFYLHDQSSSKLNQAFLESNTCFSPNPFEYFLLADKQRMIEWQSKPFEEVMAKHSELLSTIQPALPKSQVMSEWDVNELWSERKNYFLKPLRSFGSKQTYRGASISRRLFDELPREGFLVQEFVPAPEINFENEEKAFKYDLRFYAYQDKIELAIARLYQGQVTNMRTPGGGLATISFVE